MSTTRYKCLSTITLALALIAIISSGCAGGGTPAVSFSQLISQANTFNGNTVTLEAFYFAGFEISALAGSVGPSDSGPWRIVPEGTLVWVKSGVPEELFNRLYTQTETPSGYAEHIGRLKITGQFETGGKYGHLDAYKYQISITEAEMLEWTPPPAVTPETGNLQVKVTDLYGNPLAGAKVVSEEQPDGQMKVTGITGDDGTVTYNGIKAGVYRFYVNRFDYVQTEISVTITGGDTASATVNLVGERQQPDDIVNTPGGHAYRANVHQQGVENPWPPVETVEVLLESGTDTIYLRYRNDIVTGAGQTRNNIFSLRKPEVPFDPAGPGVVELKISGLQSGMTTSYEPGAGLPGINVAILKIEIPSDVQPGEYALEIGVAINGVDYGTVPCKIEVVP